MDEKPKRRIRYSGTHPKSFKEKYKEQNPEKYGDDVAKIIQQGKTPAGMHRPICVDEIMAFLNIKPGQVGMDATLGYGGHSAEILKALKGKGKLFATDVDSIELPKTTERLRALGYGEEIFFPRKMNFAGIDVIAAEAGPLNFVLADLGVSSMQIDNPDRGFSYKVEGPLDLRLNPKGKITAATILEEITQGELQELLFEYSDEQYAEPISKLIVKKRSAGLRIETTADLQQIIGEALSFIPPQERKEQVKKACQRCFQALRIAVNNEFEMLEKFLDKLPDALAPGGRVAILTFHSGEDRRVKKAFQYFLRAEIFSEITAEPVRASAEECFANPRAKSAKLRWAVKK
ncbi:MAG TPA: 16S rRNA (cytosine(1402)-N(4))-methyltransferase RsmH [Bacteroidia bacterium]|nr:16S rRNA (cytosine(1402)-N(4))-methyltransferase RsmH [Bacteroidia bacterium]